MQGWALGHAELMPIHPSLTPRPPQPRASDVPSGHGSTAVAPRTLWQLNEECCQKTCIVNANLPHSAHMHIIVPCRRGAYFIVNHQMVTWPPRNAGGHPQGSLCACDCRTRIWLTLPSLRRACMRQMLRTESSAHHTVCRALNSNGVSLLGPISSKALRRKQQRRDASAHHACASPDFMSTPRVVPSNMPRTARSATPFDCGRCGVNTT